MPEELRIVVIDGGGPTLGTAASATSPRAAATSRPASVSGTGLGGGSILSGIGAGIGIGAFNVASSVAFRTASLPGRAINSLKTEVGDLAGLSPELAGATADTELAQFARRQRRANQLGPALADFERTRSEISDKLFDIQTEFFRLALAFFKRIEPTIKELLGRTSLLTDFVVREVPNFLRGFADNLPFWFDFIKDPLRSMAGALEKLVFIAEGEDQPNNFFRQFMEQLDRPVGFWPDDQKPLPEKGPLFPVPGF